MEAEWRGVAEEHNNLFKDQTDHLDRLASAQDTFSAQLDERIRGVHSRILDVGKEFEKSLEESKADCRQGCSAKAIESFKNIFLFLAFRPLTLVINEKKIEFEVFEKILKTS